MSGKKRTMYLRPKATNRLNKLNEVEAVSCFGRSPQIGGYTRYEPIQKQVSQDKKSIQPRTT
ncbi:hypothetical protein PATA110615_32080 [Paenibacillus taichungensis]